RAPEPKLVHRLRPQLRTERQRTEFATLQRARKSFGTRVEFFRAATGQLDISLRDASEFDDREDSSPGRTEAGEPNVLRRRRTWLGVLKCDDPRARAASARPMGNEGDTHAHWT